MPFTYDTATDRGKVRLKIGDIVQNSGVKPSGANFTDDEIDIFIDEGVSVIKASALAADSLAAMWTVAPKRHTQDGLTVDRGAVADLWAKRSKEWRTQSGFTVGTPVVFGKDS